MATSMTTETKAVSIIVPFHNEEETLQRTLELIEAQTFQPDEILLVDSSSTDESVDVIRRWVNAAPLTRSRFVVIESSADTPGRARSIGASAATSELVGFMDCGLDFSVDWLARSRTLLNSLPENYWVSGVCHTQGVGLLDQCAIANTYGWGARRAALPSSLMRLSSYRRVGDFLDLRAGEDGEWIRRADAAGLVRVVDQSLVVRYFSTNYAESLSHLVSKSIAYSRPMIRSGRRRTALLSILVPLLGLAVLIVSPVTLLFASCLYVIARVTVAARKSPGRRSFLFKPERLVTLVITGFVIDAGRSIGVCLSLLDLLSSTTKRQIPAR